MILQKDEKVHQLHKMEYKMGKIKVTQIKSAIGRNKKQKKILIGLGLNKINRSKNLNDNDSIKGMIDKVKHLVRIEGIK